MAGKGLSRHCQRKREERRIHQIFGLEKHFAEKKTSNHTGETYPGTIMYNNDSKKTKLHARATVRLRSLEIIVRRFILDALHVMCEFTVLHADEEGGKGKKRNCWDPPILL